LKVALREAGSVTVLSALCPAPKLAQNDYNPDDPDAFTYRKGGGKEFRNPFGGLCPRYVKMKTTYDPISDRLKEISPPRQHMLTFLTRWMQDFQIDGIRMDSVESVANWDFIRDFKNEADNF
jgi:pullulanase